MADIFVSYASDDRDRIRPLVEALEARGWTVWWDREIAPGSTWAQTIEKAIDTAACVVVVWSESSVKSEWVNTEAQEGLDRHILVPVLLDDVQIPLVFRRTQAANLRGWPKSATGKQEFDRLVWGISQTLGAASDVSDRPARAANAPAEPASRRPIFKPLAIAVAALAAIGAGVALYLNPWIGWNGSPGEAENEIAATDIDAAKSLAILPLENLSPNSENAFFASGLHDELLSRIAQQHQLRVISRTAVMQYAGTSLTTREIGRDLNVGSVLEGSVRFAGNRVRITVQLIDTADDTHIWSETYDRDLDDVFDVQSDIARQITASLIAELTNPEEARQANRPTQSDEAWSLFLNVSSPFNMDDWREKVSMMERAIEFDPEFAEAYGMLALLHNGSPVVDDSVDVLEAQDLARQFSLRADALGPDGLMAQIARGLRHQIDLNWQAAAVAYKEAYRTFRPLSFDQYAPVLLALGRADEAIASAEASIGYGPGDFARRKHLLDIYRFARREPEATEFSASLVNLFPEMYEAHQARAWILMDASKFDEAQRAVEKMSELVSPEQRWKVLHTLGALHAYTGDEKRALEILSELEKIDETEVVSPMAFVSLHLALGHTERAIDWMERAAAFRGKNAVFIGSALFRDFRSQARYVSLLEELRLVP